MKDPRIEKLAENLINYSVELKPGEKILIEVIGNELPLTKALIRHAYKAGGVPFFTIKNNELLGYSLMIVPKNRSRPWHPMKWSE
jgi:aminopeptidase